MSQPPKKPAKPWTARRIHLWIAVILALPMILVAVSGILISMRSISEIKIPLSWLAAENVPDRLPLSAYAQSGKVSWIGNAQGLNKVSEEEVTPIAHFAGQEIIAIALIPGQENPIVATRMALWSEKDGTWLAVLRGRVRQLSPLPDGRVLSIIGGRGEMADGRPMISADGQEWKPHGPAIAANKQLPPLENPQVALHQWMRELHAGAYFFGKGPGEMVWSNVLGWVLVLLCLTGLWIWWKTERAKLRSQQRKVQKVPPMTQPVSLKEST